MGRAPTRSMRAIAVLGVSVAGTLVVASCVPKLPAPLYTSQPTSALEEIPYPPPPARAESVPPKPRTGAVWLDGEWVWQARRWSWRPGRWVMPPAGARFAPWVTVRDRMGTLYLASGTWRDERGAAVSEGRPLVVAVPGGGAIVSPEGNKIEQGPLAPLEQKGANEGDD